MKSTRSLLASGIAIVAVLILLSACSSSPTITGTWKASDGSTTKIINDDGSCTGMYYNVGKVLDIGGPETCTLSSEEHNGYYDLIVRQPPNQETLQVSVQDSTMTLHSNGTELVILTKQ